MDIIILSGISGSGKGRYAREVLGAESGAGVVALEITEGEIDPGRHARAFAEYLSLLVARPRKIVVALANTRERELYAYTLAARASGVEPEIHVIDTPLLVAQTRSIAPKDAVKRQHERLQALLASWPAEIPTPRVVKGE